VTLIFELAQLTVAMDYISANFGVDSSSQSFQSEDEHRHTVTDATPLITISHASATTDMG